MFVHLHEPRVSFLIGLCTYGNIRQPQLDSVYVSIIAVTSMALGEYPTRMEMLFHVGTFFACWVTLHGEGTETDGCVRELIQIVGTF